KYVSMLMRQDNGTYKYESKRKETELSHKALSIPAGGMKYPLPTENPGDFAILIRDAKGQTVQRIEFGIAGVGNLTRSLEKNAELKIGLKSADVQPGQDIELQIKAPYTGAGLITIERDHVYAHRWFKSSTTSTVQTIRLPAD